MDKLDLDEVGMDELALGRSGCHRVDEVTVPPTNRQRSFPGQRSKKSHYVDAKVSKLVLCGSAIWEATKTN